MINNPSRNRASSTNVSESAADIICAVRAEDCRRDCRNEKCKKGKLKDWTKSKPINRYLIGSNY